MIVEKSILPMQVMDDLPIGDGRHSVISMDLVRDGSSEESTWSPILLVSRELHDQLVEWTTLVR